MKFHLSTIFLLFVVVAVSLSWYVDHNDRRRKEIVGKWRYPHQGLGFSVSGSGSTLEIRSDGAFTKFQWTRGGTNTFEGKYTCEEDGLINFHVTSRTTKSVLDEMLKSEPKTEEIYLDYSCRCAVDKMGYLIVAECAFPFLLEENKGPSGIQWESSFAPAAKE